MRMTYGAVLPLPPREAFSFVADPLSWPLFITSMRDSGRGTDWERVGGTAWMTNAFLWRTVRSELEMTVWDPPREFRYVARQRGGPPLDNRRVFEAVPEGTRLRGTTELELRPGVLGLLDRGQVWALRRTYEAAMARLPAAAAAARGSAAE